MWSAWSRSSEAQDEGRWRSIRLFWRPPAVRGPGVRARLWRQRPARAARLPAGARLRSPRTRRHTRSAWFGVDAVPGGDLDLPVALGPAEDYLPHRDVVAGPRLVQDVERVGDHLDVVGAVRHV